MYLESGYLISAFLRRTCLCVIQVTEDQMKIIAYDTFKAGVTLETITPFLREEVANVWRLWKAGIVRENYARADEPGVVIIFECASVQEVKSYIDDFPLTRRGFLDWQFIALDAPLPLEYLFNQGIDIGEPYDRRGLAK
jgi:hypothetical protein